MIIITDAKILEVHGDRADIMRAPVFEPLRSIFEATRSCFIPIETIPGRWLRSPKGDVCVCVGMDKNIAEALGLTLEVWQGMERSLADARQQAATYRAIMEMAHRERDQMEDELLRLSAMGFWKRLWWAITGGLVRVRLSDGVHDCRASERSCGGE